MIGILDFSLTYLQKSYPLPSGKFTSRSIKSKLPLLNLLFASCIVPTRTTSNPSSINEKSKAYPKDISSSTNSILLIKIHPHFLILL